MNNSPDLMVNIDEKADNKSFYYSPDGIKVKEHKPLEKRDIIFAILFFVSSLLLVILGICGGFHLGFTVAYFVIFGVTSAYNFKKVSVFSILCGVLSLAGSVTFALYDDHILNAIMFFVILALYTIFTLGVSDCLGSNQGSFRLLFDVLKGATSNVVTSLSDTFGSVSATFKEKKKSLGGLIGALVALPVIVVIIPLLASSDAAFEGLISTIAENVGTVIFQLVLALVITPFLFTFAFEKRRQLTKADTSLSKRKRPAQPSACISFLTVISIVYVVYLFSQLAYFFSAFGGLLPEGYKHSASAFARRGFYEMVAICIINFVIVSLCLMLSKKKTAPIKLLSTFISLFSVLMIAVAMQKMRLNISIYTLTKNRVLVSVFMIMLLVVYAFFLLHIFAPRVKYMQNIIVICSVIFMALAFCNVDARIAEYNIKAYESGEKNSVDVYTIYKLSDSAVPSLVYLVDCDSESISSDAKSYSIHLLENNDYAQRDLREFTLSGYRAQRALKTVANLR